MKKTYKFILLVVLLISIFPINVRASYWIGKLANYTWGYTEYGRLKVSIVSPTKAGSYDIAEEFDKMLIGTKFEKYRPTIKIQIQCHFVAHLINKVPWNIEIQRNQRDFNHGCNTESWIDNLKLTPPPSYKLPPNKCIGNMCMYSHSELDK